MNKSKDISRIILEGLFWTGAITIASTNPYFLHRLMPKLVRYAKYKIKHKVTMKSYQRSFYYLKERGLVNFSNQGKQIYISLTSEGRKKVKKYNVDNLTIKEPKKWDGRWRILIFDIEDRHKIKREGFRGKLKGLGFYKLQRSVWVYPYNFRKEIKILREFFSLNYREMRVITASEIERDEEIKSFFSLHNY